MSRIAKHLLPDSAKTNALGHLEIGGCDLITLADEFGTPTFVYDEAHLRARCQEAVRAFGKHRVVYATKAFLCGAMARLAHEEGLLLDVATGGELFVALNAGVPGSACVLHGNNKSIEELKMALDADVQHIVVDNFDELDRLDALHASGAKRARVQLRITPGVAVHTHEFVSTGQDDSKFGFNLRNGDAQRAVDRVRSSASVEFVGIHCHIGSNVFAAENFTQAAQIMVDFANQLGVDDNHDAAGHADSGISEGNFKLPSSCHSAGDHWQRHVRAVPTNRSHADGDTSPTFYVRRYKREGVAKAKVLQRGIGQTYQYFVSTSSSSGLD